MMLRMLWFLPEMLRTRTDVESVLRTIVRFNNIATKDLYHTIVWFAMDQFNTIMKFVNITGMYTSTDMLLRLRNFEMEIERQLFRNKRECNISVTYQPIFMVASDDQLAYIDNFKPYSCRSGCKDVIMYTTEKIHNTYTINTICMRSSNVCGVGRYILITPHREDVASQLGTNNPQRLASVFISDLRLLSSIDLPEYAMIEFSKDKIVLTTPSSCHHIPCISGIAKSFTITTVNDIEPIVSEQFWVSKDDLVHIDLIDEEEPLLPFVGIVYKYNNTQTTINVPWLLYCTL